MFVSEVSQLEKLSTEAWVKYKDGDKEAIADIYDMILPFCLRICSKTCGRYINGSDDEASIAQIALIEAFDKYDPDRGSLLLYLSYVIRNRVIDYKRGEDKRVVIPLSSLSKDSGSEFEIQEDSFAEEILDELARKQEIEKLRAGLAEFNISFEDLVKSSPRQKKTMILARKAALLVAGDEQISRYLQAKKMLPMKMIEERLDISRKILDRYRKFIIASALILIYDLSLLKPYVLSGEGREYGAQIKGDSARDL